MKILKRCFWCAILILCTFSGCTGRRGEETAPTTYRVVSTIRIIYRNGSVTEERRYGEQEKMQQILNYLRWIDPYGTPAEDPMAQEGEEFLVELHYSDGTTKNYHQRCDRYLRVGEEPWKKIDPERARELQRILDILDAEGSASAQDTGPSQPLLRPKLEWK